MKRIFLPSFLLVLLFPFCFSGCEQDQISDKPMTITLYDKSLHAIRTYIQGKWKLQYVQGGISGGKFFDRDSSYIIINGERFISANDKYGTVIDTTIVWKKDNYNDKPTYLLCTNWYRSPYLVDGIYNDTLRLVDYSISDGYSYYYTKW